MQNVVTFLKQLHSFNNICQNKSSDAKIKELV